MYHRISRVVGRLQLFYKPLGRA